MSKSFLRISSSKVDRFTSNQDQNHIGPFSADTFHRRKYVISVIIWNLQLSGRTPCSSDNLAVNLLVCSVAFLTLFAEWRVYEWRFVVHSCDGGGLYITELMMSWSCSDVAATILQQQQQQQKTPLDKHKDDLVDWTASASRVVPIV